MPSLLLELSNQPYQFRSKLRNGNQLPYTFTTPTSQFDVLLRSFKRIGNSDRHLAIEFYRVDTDGQEQFEITGTGDQFRVFATIVAILKDGMDKVNPAYVDFDADTYEPSRVKLYKMFAKHFTKYFPDFELADSWRNDAQQKFSFVRKDLK